MIVLLAHIIATDDVWGIYASGCGKIGVWLFMLLSGVLLIMPYLENDNKIFSVKQLPAFYSKKLLRMGPAYLFTIILCVILGIIDREDFLPHLLFESKW